MASQTDICNMALSAIGARSSIASINEGSAEANACLLHYQTTLEAVLRAAHWNFARKQLNLALLIDGTTGVAPFPPSPWLYEYAYPSDCIRARFVMPWFQTAPNAPQQVMPEPYYVGPPVRFAISSDLDINNQPVQVILTNQPQAQLVYTWRNTNTAFFDPDFVVAFSNALGVRICQPVSGDKDLSKLAMALAQATIDEAAALNGNEGITIIDNVAEWTRVRGYSADWAYPDGGLLYNGPQALQMVI